MTVIDWLSLIALCSIWLLLLINMTLTVAGYAYYIKSERTPAPVIKDYPMVTVMIPAHNESIVLAQTLTAILRFDYPADRYEVIVINDNSSDDSAQVLAEIQERNKDHNLKIINTDAVTGGKGKSNALNIGYKISSGDIIAIYDADNTPEAGALRILVSELMSDPKLGAVIGKFRTRNRNVNFLTRCINIETIAFQWMSQAGRWQLFKLCTIPGTNFVMRRTIIDAIGGWDVKALAEDTEISFRIYMMGYRIKFQPKAVTWEQEPQSLPVWFKQRKRWVMGNIYVILKNVPRLFDPRAKKIRFDILYYLSVYFLLLLSLVLSDTVFLGNTIGILHSSLAGFSVLLWMMAILLFILGTYITVTTERGEIRGSNVLIIFLMYFTYSKLWMFVAVAGLFQYLWSRVRHSQLKWDKTERYKPS